MWLPHVPTKIVNFPQFLNSPARTNNCMRRHLCDGGVPDSVHRYSDAEHKMEFNSSARADGLLRRVLTKSDMTEVFEGRFDYLHYRRISFSIPDGLSDVQHIPLKVKIETAGTKPGSFWTPYTLVCK